MPRLPQPGSDEGVWGDVLNSYLAEAHNTDGSLRDSVIAHKYEKPAQGIPATDLTSSVQVSLGKADSALQSIVDGSVSTVKLADNAVTEAKLSSAVTIKLNQTAPVQSVAGKTGVVTLTATDVGALTQAAADLRYPQSSDITHIVRLTQVAYNNISSPDPNTLYIII